MRPTRPLHEVFRMRFFDVGERFDRGMLSTDEAAEALGVSVSTFYRKRRRFAQEGEDGLVDRRIGKMSAKRIPVDKVMELISLYETQYFDFTVKHFYEKLPEHGFRLSYTLVKNKLQEAGLVRKAAKRGQHRRKRMRRPLPGMMLHQDGSSHEWTPGKRWDLIVTMDDATSEVYSMFFCEEEGTASTFRGFAETFAAQGLPCSVYLDRASHYFFTPKAGGKVDKTQLTQVGRAMRQLGIEMIPAYSPQARGRSERMFGTLQKRLPQELRLHGISDMESANRFLREIYLPKHNARFARKAEQEGSAFVPLSGFALQDILCVQEKRVVSNDNTVKYKGNIIQIQEDKVRRTYVKAAVTVREYSDGGLAVFFGPRRLLCAVLRPEEDKEVDFQDGFIACNPSSQWENEEGAEWVSPFSELGCRHGAQVAPQRCPILPTAQTLSASRATP